MPSLHEDTLRQLQASARQLLDLAETLRGQMQDAPPAAVHPPASELQALRREIDELRSDMRRRLAEAEHLLTAARHAATYPRWNYTDDLAPSGNAFRDSSGSRRPRGTNDQ